MFRNMAKSLVTHEKIKTTLPKAKELSRVADRLVTLALRGDLSAKRQAYKVLGNHKLVKRLFDEIAPRFEKHSGGYTRVVKYAKPRVGDSASLALIEFTYKTSEGPEVTKAGLPKDKAQTKGAPAAAPAGPAASEPVPEKDSSITPEDQKQVEPEAQFPEAEDSTAADREADEQSQEDKSEESRPHDDPGEDPEQKK